VHPEFLAYQKLPEGKRGKAFWNHRYEDINSFEQHLLRNGTKIIKFFLNVSKAEQKKRFLKRLDEPEKNWKFSAQDLIERNYWDDYMQAYEEALAATSTAAAPWYVIPADEKWVMRTLVANLIANTIQRLDLHYPQLPPEELAQFADYRRQLLSET
jgi:polyphosphate kinase 2 (PPK2 family)